MIFVTVGTHEQPFNRLVEEVDHLKQKGFVSDDVTIQIGFSKYEPKYCEWSRLYSYQEMMDKVNRARIVITHGGPSSFIMPLQIGKIPIVVPRQKKYNEHINDHQVEFVKAVAKRKKNILVAMDMIELKDIICNYDLYVKNMNPKLNSNNRKFNEELEKIVKQMYI